MPADVEQKLRIQGLLRSPGPHAPDTVRRLPCHLVDPDEMARAGRFFRFPCPQIRSLTGRACDATAKEAEKRQGRHRGCSVQTYRDLRDRELT